MNKTLEEQIETIITEAVESQMDYDEWTSGRCEDVEDKIMSLINKAILNERTKTLEMLKDEPIEKVKIPHESARRGYYIRTKDAGAYARNKFRRNLRDKIKENYG